MITNENIHLAGLESRVRYGVGSWFYHHFEAYYTGV
jgi:hypothetical protein